MADDIRQAHESQEVIAWYQVMFGRISKVWATIAITQDTSIVYYKRGWITKVIKCRWKFGLELWTVRNQLVDGKTGGISKLEWIRVQRLITVMHRDLLPQIDTSMRDIFQRSKKDLLVLPYNSQLAWLGKLKFLFPVWYRKIETTEAHTVMSHTKVEHMAMAQLGTNII